MRPLVVDECLEIFPEVCDNYCVFGRPHKPTEDAVRWRLFDQTISQIHHAFADLHADELDGIINEAVTDVRAENRRPRKRRSGVQGKL